MLLLGPVLGGEILTGGRNVVLIRAGLEDPVIGFAPTAPRLPLGRVQPSPTSCSSAEG